tara:strand:- start:28 stop:969 length:942 start_codon:yes stop_codon:yes gene_type:complete
MALTKVNNDLQDALAAAQPTITSVGTLTGLTVGGNLSVVSSDSYAIFKMRTDANDDGSNDDGIIQITNGSSDVVKAELRWDESTNTVELGHGDNQGHLVIDSGGKVAIGSTVANKIFNIADPAQGGEALKLHFEAVASADKWAIYAYDRTNGHYANMSFGANSLAIDNGGRVTMPSQPAFQVNPSSVQYNIPINAHTTIAFGTEVFDVGANFASNTFTAPVTGKYQLNASIRVDNIDSDASYYQIRIATSNRDYIITFDLRNLSDDPAYWTKSISVLADMDASDTVHVSIIQANGTAQSDIHNESKFSGILVA